MTPVTLLTDALASAAPALPADDDRMVFGRLIGRWRVDVTFLDDAGEVVLHGPGTWDFGWILGGRGVQDVLAYSLRDRAGVEHAGIGTTVRIHRPAERDWSVVWFGASSGVTVVLTGRPTDTGMQLLGSEGPGIRNRWTFTDVTADAFEWRGEISHDDGATWRVEQTMSARRQP